MATTEYTVAGMSCGHCERAIREEVEKIAGVTDIAVSAQTGILGVTGTATDAEILAAVDEAGYSAERSA